MDLSEYITVLRKRSLVIIVLGFLGFLAAFGLARSTTPTYTATSKVYVSLTNSETTSDLLQGSAYVKNLIDSYAALANMPVVLDAVAEDLDLPDPGRALAGSVSASSPLNTSIIEIKSTSTDPQRAADIANATATELSNTVEDLSSSSSPTAKSVEVSVVSPATVPSYPSAPRTKLMVIIGALLGAVVGVVGALLWAMLDTRIRSPRDLESLDDAAAILGSVPRSMRGRAGLAVVDDPLGAAAEAYRRIQTNLSYIDIAQPAKVVLLTSSVPSEGKSTTAKQLALTLAEGSRRVLLLEADMRRPSLAATLGLESSAGLTTVLAGRANLHDVVQTFGATGLDVLTAGPVPPNPHQLLESPSMRRIIEEARADYDAVIIDAPPLLPVSDAAVLAPLADGSIVVVGCKKVRRRQLALALRALETVGARVLGFIVTFAPRSASEGTYYVYRDRGPRWRGWLRRDHRLGGHHAYVTAAERAEVSAAVPASPADDDTTSASDATPVTVASDPVGATEAVAPGDAARDADQDPQAPAPASDATSDLTGPALAKPAAADSPEPPSKPARSAPSKRTADRPAPVRPELVTTPGPKEHR